MEVRNNKTTYEYICFDIWWQLCNDIFYVRYLMKNLHHIYEIKMLNAKKTRTDIRHHHHGYLCYHGPFDYTIYLHTTAYVEHLSAPNRYW